MSDNVDHNMQRDAPFDYESADWSTLHGVVTDEPWKVDFDWADFEDQGAEALPGDGNIRTGVSPFKSHADFLGAPRSNLPSHGFPTLPAIDRDRFQEHGSGIGSRVDNAYMNSGLFAPYLERADGPQTSTNGDLSSPDHLYNERGPTPIPLQEDTVNQSNSSQATFKCDVAGCKTKPFKRKGDLNRHRRKHDRSITWDCPAVYCDRTGTRAFDRRDKLKDHVLAGHDDDTLFECGNCARRFTRDLFSIHTANCYPIYDDFRWPIFSLSHYCCPMPKCPFRIRFGWGKHRLDELQEHLLVKHDAKGRQAFADRIRDRGYDNLTGDVVCPICQERFPFPGHSKFHRHFLATHLEGVVSSVVLHDCSDDDIETGWKLNGLVLMKSTDVTEDTRSHRRTILSLWPAFAKLDAVWEDLRRHY